MNPKIQLWLSEVQEYIWQTFRFLLLDNVAESPRRCKTWLESRFKSWFWDWLRNSVLFILAALTVKFTYYLLEFAIQEIITIPNLLQSNNYTKIVIFGIIIILVFITIKFFIKFKNMRFFVFSTVGFLAVMMSSNFIEWLTKLSLKDRSNFTEESIILKLINSTFNQTIDWQKILNFTNILQLIAVILFGIFLYLFVRFLSQSTGIDILPFDDSNLEWKDESNNKLSGGRAIADLLSVELHRIHHLHHFIEDGKLQLIQTSSPLLRICREDLDLGLFKGENLGKSLLQTGSISITDKTTLKLNEILLMIRQLWPSGSVKIVTGSIHSHESKLYLTARYEQTNHQADVHAYEVNQTEVELDKTNRLVPEMVKMLAYRIALDSSSIALSTSNWAAFQFFTEAISHFYRHERTKGMQSSIELNKAFKCCKKAHEKDKDYLKVGDLLSLIAFSYLNKDKYEKAKEALDKALEINPRSSYVHTAYGNMYYLLGRNEEALEHYKYAKELDPTRPALYMRTGCVYTVAPYCLKNYGKARQDFWNALSLDPKNSAAQSLLAWLDFVCYLEEQKQSHYKQAEISLSKAFNRLKRIKKDKKTYIDYSNLAIFFLHQENYKKAYENWWRALQLCPDLTSDISSDKLHHIFYRLLLAPSIEDVDQEIIKLNQILIDHQIIYRRVIEDLLLDAIIVLNKCIAVYQINEGNEQSIFSIHTSHLNLDIIQSNPISENYRRLGTSMKNFIEVLQQYLSIHFDQT
jgi:tetratricopeptide (TPR) repeat protein